MQTDPGGDDPKVSLRGFSSKQMGDACEMLVAGELTLPSPRGAVTLLRPFLACAVTEKPALRACCRLGPVASLASPLGSPFTREADFDSPTSKSATAGPAAAKAGQPCRH
jgi:hypothetical protein